jgi:hypothetical protein
LVGVGSSGVGDFESLLKQVTFLGDGVFDPSWLRGETNRKAICLRGLKPEGPGWLGYKTPHAEPADGMELRRLTARSSGCRNNSSYLRRERTTDPGRVLTRNRLSQGRHWHYPRRYITRPAPSLEGQSYSIPQGNRARANADAHLEADLSVRVPREGGDPVTIVREKQA